MLTLPCGSTQYLWSAGIDGEFSLSSRGALYQNFPTTTVLALVAHGCLSPTLPALDVEKTKGRNTTHSLPKPQGQIQKKREKGVRGVLIWSSLVLLQRTETPSSGSCLSVFLWLSIYSKCSTSISPRGTIWKLHWGQKSIVGLPEVQIPCITYYSCQFTFEGNQDVH